MTRPASCRGRPAGARSRWSSRCCRAPARGPGSSSLRTMARAVVLDGRPCGASVIGAQRPQRSGSAREGKRTCRSCGGARARWRERRLRVTIDGTAWPIPASPRQRRRAVAHHGVYTESHDMLIVRAGTRRHDRGPAARMDRYRIERDSRRRCPPRRCRAGGSAIDWELHRIDLGTRRRHEVPTASVVFEAAGRFRLRLDGASAAVDGEVHVDGDSEAGVIHLLPLRTGLGPGTRRTSADLAQWTAASRWRRRSASGRRPARSRRARERAVPCRCSAAHRRARSRGARADRAARHRAPAGCRRCLRDSSCA